MDEATPYAEGEVGFELTALFAEQHSAMKEPLELVIRDPEQWRDLWSQVVADRHPPRDPPEVDFNRDMVVLVAIGERPTGGFSVEIVEVRLHEGALRVASLERMPGSSCIVPQVLTAPVAAVTMPSTEGPASFEHQTETYECD